MSEYVERVARIGEYVGELPIGKWEMVRYGEYIICTCPDHEPRIVKDSQITVLDDCWDETLR